LGKLNLQFPPQVFTAANQALVAGTRKLPSDLGMKGAKKSREMVAVVAQLAKFNHMTTFSPHPKAKMLIHRTAHCPPSLPATAGVWGKQQNKSEGKGTEQLSQTQVRMTQAE
jgi:hypothetical protein